MVNAASSPPPGQLDPTLPGPPDKLAERLVIQRIEPRRLPIDDLLGHRLSRFHHAHLMQLHHVQELQRPYSPLRAWRPRDLALGIGLPDARSLRAVLGRWIKEGILQRTGRGLYTLHPEWISPDPLALAAPS